MGTGEDELTSLRETFFEEAEERLRTLESLFLSFEGYSDDLEIVNTIFREVHSLKGGAAACGLDEFTNFAHLFESLLSQVRLGLLKPTAETHAVMLESVDALDSLFRRARNFVGRLDDGDVAMIAARIRQELGLRHSEYFSGREKEVVLWLEEKGDQGSELPTPERDAATAPATLELPHEPLAEVIHDEASAEYVECTQQPSSREAADQVVAECEEDEAETSSLPDVDMNRLVDLAVELAITSSALSHALSDSAALQMDRVRALFSESCVHADAIQHTLEEIRTEGASAISEVVLVAVSEHSYFLPLSCVDNYFSLEPGMLRSVPEMGDVIDLDRATLHLVRLSDLLQRSDERSAGAVLVATRPQVGPFALLVDQVMEQTRVVIRPLDPMFQRCGSVLGAAIYAGQVVLVLDPVRLCSVGRSRPALDMAVA